MGGGAGRGVRFARLRIGVTPALLAMAPAGGHGKVWHRMLAALRERARLVALDAPGRVARRRRRVDVVLADGHDELPRTDVPVVVAIHEVGWRSPQLRALLNPEFLAGIEHRTELAVREAVHVLTPSQCSRRDVLELYGCDGGRVHVVSYGVDPVFAPTAAGGAELVAGTRGREAPAPYVLYAAILHPRKNLAALREAMTALAADGFPHLLVVAGRPAPDGSDVAALARAAGAELPGAPGRVVFMGQPSDGELAGLMAGAAAYCLPSLYEGFGLTALEAMACGTPVVVSDRGALPEVVGAAGLVVAPEPEPIADALRAVLSDPWLARDMGRAGEERSAGFSWERTADGWLRVLQAAARGG
jgi:glycosyltransferase involved in cell wall biosynthesis